MNALDVFVWCVFLWRPKLITISLQALLADLLKLLANKFKKKIEKKCYVNLTYLW